MQRKNRKRERQVATTGGKTVCFYGNKVETNHREAFPPPHHYFFHLKRMRLPPFLSWRATAGKLPVREKRKKAPVILNRLLTGKGIRQQTDRSVNYLHKGNDRAEPAAHQEEDKERKDSPVSPISSEVRRDKRKEAIPGLEKLRVQDQEEKKFVKQMDRERSVQQDIVLNKDIPERLRVMTQDMITGESPVFTVKQKKSRPEGPKVTIGSIEVIIEAPAVPSNTVKQRASSPSLSSRRYLRRL